MVSLQRARLAALGVCAGLGLSACKQEVNFTRVPAAASVEPAARASDTAVFLSLPLDLAAVQEAAERALPERLAKVVDWLNDAACDRRGASGLQCMDGKAEGEITRAGPVQMTAEAGRLLLSVPLRYDISVRGMGWTSYLRERKTGVVTVRVPFEAALGAGYRMDPRPAGDMVWSERTVPLLRGKLQLAKFTDAKIRVALKDASETLRRTLEARSLRDAAERGWRGLHAPILLASSPSLWLRGAPERVMGAGFALDNGVPAYRIAVTTKMSVHTGERPAPLFLKPLPEPSRALAAPQTTTLRLPLDISSLPMQRAVAIAFSPQDDIETQPDPKAPPVVVRAARASVYPSGSRIALELQLDVVTPKRMFGMTGKAYLLGKPVLKPETGTLELEDIGFPTAPPKEAKSARQPILRIGEEPFAGRLAAAARMNVGREIAAFLPRLNGMVNQRLDETLQLQGAFEKAEVVGVEPIRDAFRLNLELTGQLALHFAPMAPVATPTPALSQPTAGAAVLPPPLEISDRR